MRIDSRARGCCWADRRHLRCHTARARPNDWANSSRHKKREEKTANGDQTGCSAQFRANNAGGKFR